MNAEQAREEYIKFRIEQLEELIEPLKKYEEELKRLKCHN